jgi:thioredoxin 1
LNSQISKTNFNYCFISHKFRNFVLIPNNNQIKKDMALAITDATFDEVVLKSDKPVVVDFWAAWCGPCRMVGPVIDEVSSEYEGKAVVGKVDVDANQEFAAKYGVRNIPTVLIFQNGEVVGRQVGVAPKKTYTDAIDALL